MRIEALLIECEQAMRQADFVLTGYSHTGNGPERIESRIVALSDLRKASMAIEEYRRKELPTWQ